MSKIPAGVGPKLPQVVVLFGATGDLSQRKLLPGLFHLIDGGLHPEVPDHRRLARRHRRPKSSGPSPKRRSRSTTTIQARRRRRGPRSRRGARLRPDQGRRARSPPPSSGACAALGGECQIVHYLSVPPSAALSALKMVQEAGLSAGSRIIMEKPFGHDLESAIALNAELHKVFSEDQIFRIDHFLGKEPAQNILAFRFGNGLFEPIWNRNFIDHVQIDVPETLEIGNRIGFYEQTGAYRDMVVTHLFQILGFVAMEPPTSLAPDPISEEKNKVFRSLMPIDPANVVRGQYIGYRKEKGVDPESDTETFIALKCRIDNWRWAGVPFYLRTGKRMAQGQRIISIAFKEPPRSMFPEDSGLGFQGPDHLTFDLADETRVSLSFYGKKPGPGMRLAKQSLQFRAARHRPRATTCWRPTSG